MVKKSVAFAKRNRKRLLFYCAVLALPILQFCVFYIGVNLNSVLLAFRRYDFGTGGFVWAGFDNLEQACRDLIELDMFRSSAKNSIIVFLFTQLFGISFALIFSYFIYKKMTGSGFFKVILFMPQIVSSVVMVIIYKYFVERAYSAVVEMLTGNTAEGLLASPDTRFGTILFFTIWAGFGTQVLMYTSAMGGISESVVDAARIDGASPLREFWNITIPGVWSTLVTFVTVGVAHIFTNQMNLYSFYGTQADYDLYTFGYFLYKSVQETKSMTNYPYIASFGLIFTVIAVPLTFAVKWLFERFGPKTD